MHMYIYFVLGPCLKVLASKCLNPGFTSILVHIRISLKMLNFRRRVHSRHDIHVVRSILFSYHVRLRYKFRCTHFMGVLCVPTKQLIYSVTILNNIHYLGLTEFRDSSRPKIFSLRRIAYFIHEKSLRGA